MSMGYTYVWEFKVLDEARPEFERHYGSEGSWVRLFRLSPGFIGTTLLKDRANEGRFLTIDRWRSEEAYLALRANFTQQYNQLDSDCEALTMEETFLGAFFDHCA